MNLSHDPPSSTRFLFSLYSFLFLVFQYVILCITIYFVPFVLFISSVFTKNILEP